MVDVGGKAATHRVAVASGCIRMRPETLALIEQGAAKKGDVACESNTDPFLTGYVPKCSQKMRFSYAGSADQNRTAKRLNELAIK